MKKIISSLVLTFIIILLSSCHGILEKDKVKSALTYDVPETFDVNKEYNITFWAKNDNNAQQQKIYEACIRNFNTFYPNIHVEIVQYNDYNRIYEDVISNRPTNTTPNVCIAYPDHVASYLIGTDVVVPLDSFIDDEKFGLGGSEVLYESPKKDEIVSKFLKEGTLDGTIYTLPFMRSSEACYVNVDYLTKLGYELPDVLTWDFVWEVCEKAMKEKASNQTLIPLIYKSTDNMCISLLKQYGLSYTSDDSKVYMFNDGFKTILSKLQKYADLGYWDTFKRVSYPGNFFNRGQCIFAIDSTAGATWMGSNCPNLDIKKDEITEFTTAVRAIPQADKNNPSMISQGPSVCLFNKEDKGEVLASWLFAQYLLNDTTQVNFSKTEGYIPVTTKAINSQKYQDYLQRRGENNSTYYYVKIDAAKLVIDNINNTFITSAFNGSASVRNAAGEVMEGLFSLDYKNEKFDELYQFAINKYRLTELCEIENSNISISNDSSKLPNASIALITILAIIWIFLISYGIYKLILRKRYNN